MAVLRHLVGLEAVVDLAKLRGQPRLPPGAADPGLAVGDERIQADQLVLHQRGEPQDDGGGVAAGVAHQPGPADRVAVDLRQAVDRLGQQPFGAVSLVILLVDRGVLEAEVGAQVHHLAVPGQKLGHHRHGGLMRHAGEDHCRGRGDGLGIRKDEGQVADAG